MYKESIEQWVNDFLLELEESRGTGPCVREYGCFESCPDLNKCLGELEDERSEFYRHLENVETNEPPAPRKTPLRRDIDRTLKLFINRKLRRRKRFTKADKDTFYPLDSCYSVGVTFGVDLDLTFSQGLYDALLDGPLSVDGSLMTIYDEVTHLKWLLWASTQDETTVRCSNTVVWKYYYKKICAVGYGFLENLVERLEEIIVNHHDPSLEITEATNRSNLPSKPFESLERGIGCQNPSMSLSGQIQPIDDDSNDVFPLHELEILNKTAGNRTIIVRESFEPVRVEESSQPSKDPLEHFDFGDFYRHFLTFDTRSRPSANGDHKAYCPFHEDDTPSLSVNFVKGQYYCFGCGSKGHVHGFLDKIYPDRFVDRSSKIKFLKGREWETRTPEMTYKRTVAINAPDPFRPVKLPPRQKVAVHTEKYTYKAYTDTLAYEKYRYDFADGTKTFRISGTRSLPVFYKEKELVDFLEDGGKHVFVFEGERKVEWAVNNGLMAICMDTGANSRWHARLVEAINRHIKGDVTFYLVPDNDEPGRNYIEGYKEHLGRIDKITFKEVNLPVGSKEDILDYVEQGHTLDEFLTLCE